MYFVRSGFSGRYGAEVSGVALAWDSSTSSFKILLDGSYTNSISKCSAEALLLRPFFEENRAPVRSILKIWKKIAVPCGAS